MSNDQKLNLLVAYPYMKPDVVSILKTHQDEIRFLLDSGAFTAWKAGKPIALDDYCRFIESLPITPWRYFTLDVIGDAKRSFQNYQTMLDRGFKPIPVFTRGEDLSMIEEYYKTSEVLGIGGLVGTKGNLGFVKAIMSKVGNRKVHWLGFTKSDFVNFYKPYMCDSSGWSYASRMGDLKTYIGNGKMKSYRRFDFIKKPDPKILSLFESYGVTREQLSSNEFWFDGKELSRLTAMMWVKRSLETFQKLQTNLFMACGDKNSLHLLLNSFNHFKRKTS